MLVLLLEKVLKQKGFKNLSAKKGKFSRNI